MVEGSRIEPPSGCVELKHAIHNRVLIDSIDMHAGSAGEEFGQFATAFGDEEIERDTEGHIVHPSAMGVEYGEGIFRLNLGDPFDGAALQSALLADLSGYLRSTPNHGFLSGAVLMVTLHLVTVTQRWAIRFTI
jgi:hypothetical protein